MWRLRGHLTLIIILAAPSLCHFITASKISWSLTSLSMVFSHSGLRRLLSWRQFMHCRTPVLLNAWFRLCLSAWQMTQHWAGDKASSHAGESHIKCWFGLGLYVHGSAGFISKHIMCRSLTRISDTPKLPKIFHFDMVSWTYDPEKYAFLSQNGMQNSMHYEVLEIMPYDPLFTANQLGFCKKVWLRRDYALRELWLMRALTVPE